MALIKCPECGTEVSDKAQNCSKCGYPIEALSPSGTVKIKLSFLKHQSGFSSKQKASIISGEKTLWEGQVGDIAEIYFDGETEITVKYHTSMTKFGAKCSGTISPSKSKKYAVATSKSAMGMGAGSIKLQAVDVFDAD